MVTLVVYVDKYEKSFNEYEWIFSNPFEVQENIKFVEKGSYVKIWRVNYVLLNEIPNFVLISVNL